MSHFAFHFNYFQTFWIRKYLGLSKEAAAEPTQQVLEIFGLKDEEDGEEDGDVEMSAAASQRLLGTSVTASTPSRIKAQKSSRVSAPG